MVDVPDDATTATVLEFNADATVGTYSDHIDYLGDHDWIRVTLQTGIAYHFFASAQQPGFDFGNTTLSLRDSTGVQVAFNDDISFQNLNSFLQFTPSSSATYYLDVSTSLETGGAYSLLMTRVAATNVFGTDADDVMLVSAGQRVAGGGGDDTITIADGGLDALGEGGHDHIAGNNTQNRISGGLGNDYVFSAGGDDILFGDAGDDVLLGQADQDQLFGGDGFDKMDGSTGVDILKGGADNDQLKGGPGNDTMDGGAGVDAADYLSEAGALLVSLNGASNVTVFRNGVAEDTIRNIEDVLGGEGADKLTGGALANALHGGPGSDTLNGAGGNDRLLGGPNNDILNGGAGNDRMDGGGDNDGYFVDAAGDQIIEAAGSGSDNVRAGASYTLAVSVWVETLQTLGGSTTYAVNLTGNAINNTILGNNGANVINGRAGNDVLGGLGGSDIFRFDTTPSSTTNRDTISDFNAAADTIQLQNSVFTALTTTGTLAAAAFRIGSAAADSSDRIIYNSTTGALIYDLNGNVSGGATQFAKLAAGLAMTNADFVVI